MPAALFGRLIRSLMVNLGVVAVWLIIVKIIPPLRRHPALANGVGAALSLLVGYVAVTTGEVVTGVIAVAIVLPLLWWNYERDTRALAKKPA